MVTEFIKGFNQIKKHIKLEKWQESTQNVDVTVIKMTRPPSAVHSIKDGPVWLHAILDLYFTQEFAPQEFSPRQGL